MVGMKNNLSCRFTGITPRTPHSHAPVKVKRFLTTTYPVFTAVSSVTYKWRGLNKNQQTTSTYSTIILMLCKSLMIMSLPI